MEVNIAVTGADAVAKVQRTVAQEICWVAGEEPVKEASSIQLTILKIIWKRKLLVKNICAVKRWRMMKKRAFGLGDCGGELGTFRTPGQDCSWKNPDCRGSV